MSLLYRYQSSSCEAKHRATCKGISRHAAECRSPLLACLCPPTPTLCPQDASTSNWQPFGTVPFICRHVIPFDCLDTTSVQSARLITTPCPFQGCDDPSPKITQPSCLLFTMTSKPSRWNFLQQAVASVESRLDNILAEDDQPPKRASTPVQSSKDPAPAKRSRFPRIAIAFQY